MKKKKELGIPLWKRWEKILSLCVCVYYRFGEEVLDRVVIAVVIDDEGVAMVTPDKIEKNKEESFLNFDFVWFHGPLVSKIRK